MKMSQYLFRMISHVLYGGSGKPDPSISDYRWAAMLAHINREWVGRRA